MNTWQQGSAVDLRRNDKTGSQLVTYRTRSKYSGTEGLWES